MTANGVSVLTAERYDGFPDKSGSALGHDSHFDNEAFYIDK